MRPEVINLISNPPHPPPLYGRRSYGRQHLPGVQDWGREEEKEITEADLGGGCRGCTLPPFPEMTCGFLIQLVFCKKKNYVVYWC